jgi:maltose O-acetyltransferase
MIMDFFRDVVAHPILRKPLSYIARALDWARNRERYATYRSKYDIADSFTFLGEFTKFSGNGDIRIGPDGHIGGFCRFTCVSGTKLHIGKGCAIGKNVRIYTSEALPERNRLDSSDNRSSEGDVIIGDGVWIGNNAYISEGVRIGDHSVIGANAVVTEDIEPNVLAGGIPAKPIRELEK